MNAPWNAARTTRDSFAAFVADEQSAKTLRSVLDEVGSGDEKVHQGGLRNAIQTLAVSASPSILVVDLSECGDPLADISGLAEVCEAGTLVLAIGHINDVQLYRDLIADGIHDYLLKPLDSQALRQSLLDAQSLVHATKPKSNADPMHQHVSVAVIGTRGGVGASSVATSLAWLLATSHNKSTALLDLDVHFGSGALMMDVEAGKGLTDALDNPARIDGLFIERAMVRPCDNLSLLSAEASLSAPLGRDGAAFHQLQDEFRRAFEVAVIDMPRQVLVDFLPMLSQIDVVVITTELTLAGARDAIRILALLASQGNHLKTFVAANKVPASGGEVSRKDFEAAIERPLDFVIPLDLQTAAKAAKSGAVFAKAQPSGKSAQPLRELAATVLDGNTDSAPHDAKASLPDKLIGLLHSVGMKSRTGGAVKP
ncbi:P-loop NTPase [Croceicoccus sp. F390]|uniref:P-loop NTPase n=1 Tax=Croceicoccus esteveae TaxID=3075597 RepID=A0ABU2ZGI3_9SPHN|nr:P-loop NTPase [Croceicoccus sp. F390]MDT0575694.1 P-loop NTPase [Croceicoccus sp. F390]